jgi:hypothetical protein
MRNIRYQTLRTISYVSGKAPGIELIRGVKTHRLGIGLRAQVTIAGGLGGSVRAEGVERLVPRLKLIENGETTVELTGRLLSYLTARAQKQAAAISQLSSAANGTYQLSADWVIDFAHVWGADPSETAYVERDSRFPTLLEIEFAANPQAELITGSGLTLDFLRVIPFQMYDPLSTVMPFYLPRYKLITSDAVTGTQVDFPIFLYPEAGARVEAVVLHALTDGASNPSVLNGNVTLRGDKFRYVDRVDRLSMLNETRTYFSFPVPSLSYFEFNSRFYGKLSEMFITGQDDNFRAEVDCTNPGTSTVFNALLIEKLPVPGYTRALPDRW